MKLIQALFIALLFLGCNKENNITPREGSLAVTINDERVQFDFPSAYITDLNGFPSFGIIGTKNQNAFIISYIQVDTIDTPSPISISPSDDCADLEKYIFYTYTNTAERFQYDTDCEIEGAVVIDFSILEYTVGGRLKGTFSGVLTEEETGELLNLKGGQFDVIINK